MIGLVMRYVLATLDTGAAIALLWATAKITANFGIWSRQERWALIRRTVQFSMTLALLYLGIGRFDGRYPVPTFDQFLAGATIASGIIFFPLMRACGFISQDELLDWAREPEAPPRSGTVFRGRPTTAKN